MINIPDLINGFFELFGGLFVLNHCRVLYKDKMVRGVSLLSTVFFTSWGIWNLYYYYHLSQWLSWYGGMLLVFTNALWIGLMVKYRNNK